MFSCLFYYKQKGNIFLSPLDPLGCGCLLFLNKAAQIRERTKLSHFSCLIPAGTWKIPQWQQHLVLTCTLSFPNPQHLSQFLFPDVTHVFPEFPAPDLGNVLLQEGFTLNDVKTLQILYRRHCEVIVCNILWGLFGIDLLTDVGHHLCDQLISHSEEKLEYNREFFICQELQLKHCALCGFFIMWAVFC